MAITHGGDVFEAAARLGVDRRAILDFSASINPLGPSPAAREAILASMDSIAHYPSRSGERLRAALAQRWNINGDRILTGNGATELLFDWTRFVGSTGTIAAPAFSEFHRAWPDASLCDLEQPETWPSNGPMVLTRPANPTGFLPSAHSVLEYARNRRDPILVDESFLDFVEGAESVIPHATGNLFVLRSLTKFWALPGLRVGVLVGDVATIADKRPPWSLNALAEEAALASLQDEIHASQTREFIRTELRWLCDQLASLSVRPPVANYLFVETDRASNLRDHAERNRVLIRDCTGWPGLRSNGVRVAVRRRWENQILVALFREVLCT